jgi:hypothetical protein
MRGESQYYRRPTGYGYADAGEKYAGEEYWYRQDQAPAGREYWEFAGARTARPAALTGLLLAVITVNLAGPWTTVPGLGR